MADADGPVPAVPPRGTGWLRFAVGGLAIAVGVAVVRWAMPGGSVGHALSWVQSLGPWAPLLFIALYAVACVLWVPASLLTLGGGAVFGLARGSVYVFAGALAGAIASFLIGRFLAGGWMARRLAQHPRMQLLDRAIEDEGWRLVLLTRLSPGFPFNLLNYAFGLTRVRLWDYVWASAVGMLPGTVLYVYLGSLVGDLSRLQEPRTRSTAEWVLLAAGLVATLVLTLHVTRRARAALAQRLDAQAPAGSVNPIPPTP